jgi:hypothetical protein
MTYHICPYGHTSFLCKLCGGTGPRRAHDFYLRCMLWIDIRGQRRENKGKTWSGQRLHCPRPGLPDAWIQATNPDVSPTPWVSSRHSPLATCQTTPRRQGWPTIGRGESFKFFCLVTLRLISNVDSDDPIQFLLILFSSPNQRLGFSNPDSSSTRLGVYDTTRRGEFSHHRSI